MVVSTRFSKRNMLHFLGGAVAAQRLAVAMEHKRGIPAYAHKRQNNRTATRSVLPPNFRLPLQASPYIMDLDFRFLTERLITEMEKRPAQYNKATPEYSDKIGK